MKKPPIPENEPQRLHCLLSMSVLDTKPEARFDRLTRIAQGIFGVPIVLVSLVDSERQWFKSKQGTELEETPRDISFCGHAIVHNGLFLVGDAPKDERFSDNPLVVGPPNIRFYAGLPLSGEDGSNVGTLCIIDTKPRSLTDDDISMMRDLADCVEDELRLKSEKAIEERLSIIIDNISDGVITINDEGKIESINRSAEKLFGYSSERIKGNEIKNLISDAEQGEFEHYFKQSLSNNGDTNNGHEFTAKRSDKSNIKVKCAVVNTPVGSNKTYTVIVRDLTP